MWRARWCRSPAFLLVIGCALITLFHSPAIAAKTEIGGSVLDTFDDGDFADGSPTTWYTGIFTEGRVYDAPSGDFIVSRGTAELPEQNATYAELFDTLVSDVSLRAQSRITDLLVANAKFPPAVSIATRICWPHLVHVCGDGTGDPNDTHLVFIDVQPTGNVLAAASAVVSREVVTDFRPEDEDIVLQLDTFGTDVKFWVWRPGERRPEEPLVQFTAEDKPETRPGGVQIGNVYAETAFRYVHVSDFPIVDLEGDFNADWILTVDDVDLLMTAIRTEQSVPLQDLDLNDQVDTEDLRIWVKELKRTWFGDANLDAEFNSGDLVAVFEAGKYEAGLETTWVEGDWNADGLFDSGDLVRAFEDGGYEQGPLPMVAAVPEPNALSLVAVALGGFALLARGRRVARRPFLSHH